jgi:hypothetical protein
MSKQTQNILINVVTKYRKSLILFIGKCREDINEVRNKSKQKAIELSIKPIFSSIQPRKKRKCLINY